MVASSGVPAADLFISHLQDIQDQSSTNLTKAKGAQSRSYDKGRRIDVVYQPGDLVWLSRRHIKTRRQISKLDFRRLGPFQVRQMVGKNSAELELTQAFSQLHPVFNVSLLMPFISMDKNHPTVPQQLEDSFVEDFIDWASISYILDHRCLSPNIHEYLIRDTDPYGLNDEWRLLTTLSPHLDQFLQNFHNNAPGKLQGPEICVIRIQKLKISKVCNPCTDLDPRASHGGCWCCGDGLQ